MTPIRIFAAAVGIVALVVGIPLVALSATTFAVAGVHDTVELPGVRLTTGDSQVLAEDIDLLIDDTTLRFLPDVGVVHVRATSMDGDPLFLGVSRGAAGSWTDSDTGTSPSISWDVTPGRWSLMLAAEPLGDGLDALVEATVPATPLRIAAAATGVLGLASAGSGALLLGAAVAGTRRRSAGAVPSAA